MTRPARVTAAAVLLMVVAGELMLAAVGCGVYALMYPCAELLPAIVGGVLLLVGFGFLLLRTATRALSGRLRRTYQAGEYTSVLGVVSGILSLFVTWLLATAVQERATVTGEKVILHVAAVVIAWANTAALLTAGFFFRNCADLGRRAANWQHSEARP